ncbi:MAG: PEP-CTERM sorting domain-containing protein, partial [Hylemonella sp.]
YSSATYGFASGGIVSLDNAAMSAAFGQTSYQSTAYSPGVNLVGSTYVGNAGGAYCAGCNGSFLLSFTNTTISNLNGVFGVGLDVQYTEGIVPYHAFATFGDGTTADFVLPSVSIQQPATFWGLTNDAGIVSVHFGEVNGASTRRDALVIDNLTIASAVPEPETYTLMLAGLVGLFVQQRRSSTSSNRHRD